MNVHTMRRAILSLAAGAAGMPTLSLGQDVAQRPDPSIFQSGDFIWPKRPNQWVPYNSGSTPSREDDKARWLRERSEFLMEVRGNPSASQALRQLAADLESMDYGEFYELYAGDKAAGSVEPFGSGGTFYVGHVAILSVEPSGTPYVIEALDGKTVWKIPYSQWLSGREGAWVWHGRLGGRSEDDRKKISLHAERYVGKPYKFWILDLADTRGFYCSKLAWLSTFEALGVAIDDNPNPSRGFWYSPKQMLKSKRIVRLFNPGNYSL